MVGGVGDDVLAPPARSDTAGGGGDRLTCQFVVYCIIGDTNKP
jgi:hypothetical protein